MPADRPLRNLAREDLLDIYTSLQSESADKRYNLRKELQADKRSNNNTFANRWVTRDQYHELIAEEIRFRNIDLPGATPETPAPAAAAESESTTTAAEAPSVEPESTAAAANEPQV